MLDFSVKFFSFLASADLNLPKPVVTHCPGLFVLSRFGSSTLLFVPNWGRPTSQLPIGKLLGLAAPVPKSVPSLNLDKKSPTSCSGPPYCLLTGRIDSNRWQSCASSSRVFQRGGRPASWSCGLRLAASGLNSVCCSRGKLREATPKQPHCAVHTQHVEQNTPHCVISHFAKLKHTVHATAASCCPLRPTSPQCTMWRISLPHITTMYDVAHISTPHHHNVWCGAYLCPTSPQCTMWRISLPHITTMYDVALKSNVAHIACGIAHSPVTLPHVVPNITQCRFSFQTILSP